jgi:carboxypeptidase family protein
MHRRRILPAAILLLTLCASPFAGNGQQTLPARPPAQPPAGAAAQQPRPPRPPSNGLILGQVVDAATNRPVSGAIVAIAVSVPAAPVMVGPNGVAMGPLNAPDDGGPRRVLTDGQGQFVFHTLPKGVFPISASAPGYMPGSYGQRIAGGLSRSIDLDDGEQVGNVTIKLWRYGSITGTVFDESGEPAVNVSVRLVRLVLRNGKRQLQPSNGMQTDDRGRYRFGSLGPGDYLIALPQTVTSVPTTVADMYNDLQQKGGQASADFSRKLNEAGAPFPDMAGTRVKGQLVQNTGFLRGSAVLPATDGRAYAYQTVFHPSAVLSTDAVVIALSSGLDRDGIDLQIRPVPVVSVSGTLMGPDGPAVNMGVRLVPGGADDFASDNGFEAAVTMTDDNGAFTFPFVPPGQFVIRATKIPRGSASEVRFVSATVNGVTTSSTSYQLATPSQNTSAQVEPTLWAEMPVAVADTNLTGLVVSMRKGLRVSGRVIFETGATPPPAPDVMQRMTVTLSRVDGINQMSPAPGRLGSDGQFTTSGYPPGRYVINSSGAGGGWVLKSLMLGGRNLDEDPLELQNGDVAGVTLTFSTQTTELSGTVRPAVGSADVDAMVVVIPADYTTWIERGANGRRTRNTIASKTGTFRVGGLPAGTYLVAAVPPEIASDLRDLKILEVIARTATRFSLGDGEKKTLDLSVSPIR